MRLLLALLVITTCVACSRPSSDTAKPAEERDKALLRTIEEPQQRAKAVEADVLKNARRVDDTLDAAEAEKQRRDEDPPR